MVLAGVPVQAVFFAPELCSSFQGTGCALLPSGFMRTAPVPFLSGPSQTWPRKLVTYVNVVPSANGSAAMSTASPMVPAPDVADALRAVASLASAPVAPAETCTVPSLSAENVQLKTWSLWPGCVTGPAGDGPETSVAAPVPAIVGAEGERPVTAASPELVTVSEAVKLLPSGSVEGIAITAVSADGICTATDEDATALALTGLPSVAS